MMPLNRKCLFQIILLGFFLSPILNSAEPHCSKPLIETPEDVIYRDIQILANQLGEEYPHETFNPQNPSLALVTMESWLSKFGKVRGELVLKAVTQLIDYSELHPELIPDISTLLAHYLDKIWEASKKHERNRLTYQDALMIINMHPTLEGIVHLTSIYNHVSEKQKVNVSNQIAGALIFPSDLESAIIRGGFELELYLPTVSASTKAKAQKAWNSVRFKYEAFLPEVSELNNPFDNEEDSELKKTRPLSIRQALSFHGQMSGHLQRARLITNEIVDRFIHERKILETEVFNAIDQSNIKTEFEDVYLLYPRIQKHIEGTQFKSDEHIPSLILLDFTNTLANNILLKTDYSLQQDLMDFFESGYDRRMGIKFFEDFDAKYYPLISVTFQWGAILEWNLKNSTNNWAAKEQQLLAKAKIAPRIVLELLLRLHPSDLVKEFVLKALHQP
jgi:hypothetical protein